MTAEHLPAALRQLAEQADIRGTSIEAAAWRRLADELDRQGTISAERLVELASGDRLHELPWLPRALHWPLRELLLDDTDAAVAAGWTTLPWLLRRLLEFRIDGPFASLLARTGILTLSELEAALEDERLASALADHGDRLRVLVEALAFERPTVPLGRAVDLLESFISATAECPDVRGMRPAGDVRRFEPLAESLVVVGTAADPAAALECICGLPSVQATLHRTARRALVLYQGSEIDVRIAAPDEAGTTLYAATGAHRHLAAMRKRQGVMRLFSREEDVYAHAGLPWIPPELRHDTGEIEAAASGSLPGLVTRKDIRGDLHMHTTYSDGGDLLVDMVRTCAELGYEYIAITDHSERAGAARTVSPAALERQRREIEQLRSRYPAMTILHGIEVEIMSDGSLDFPDHLLERLDIVLASLHDRAGQDGSQLTSRCLAAIEHPLVNVITHPRNRLVGRYDGHDLDFERIFSAAVATGTALEIDGAPGHLDMDGELARAAVAAGVTVTVDSDCHRARLLDKQMRLGIGTARRGWVNAGHVLNARPLGEVLAFVAAKRSARR